MNLLKVFVPRKACQTCERARRIGEQIQHEKYDVEIIDSLSEHGKEQKISYDIKSDLAFLVISTAGEIIKTYQGLDIPNVRILRKELSNDT